jgi:glycosyltransferase involved in cell wall biosynthesis
LCHQYRIPMLFQYFREEPLLFCVLIVFALAAFIQLVFYWGIFASLAFRRKKSYDDSPDQPVSVVICARNEYRNLAANLPLILQQDYPEFEVVVVNDNSDDDSNYLLKDFELEYKNLKIVTITQTLNFFSGKKFPLSIGIKSAKNELLLLTDADCKPRSSQWLRQMQRNFTPGTEIVLGYGAYETSPGLLNKIIRFDTLHIAMQYFSLALARLPYMGVGRNLAYRKSLFYKNNGFISHYRIPSGDDDLFVNKAANSRNTRIEISQGSHTLSEAKTKFSAWVRQKRRHFSSSKFYKTNHKFVLGLYLISQVLFLAGFLILISQLWLYQVVLGIFGLRLLSQMFIFKKCMIQLGEKNLLLLLPLFEVFFVIFNPLISLTNIFQPKVPWK